MLWKMGQDCGEGSSVVQAELQARMATGKPRRDPIDVLLCAASDSSVDVAAISPEAVSVSVPIRSSDGGLSTAAPASATEASEPTNLPTPLIGEDISTRSDSNVREAATGAQDTDSDVDDDENGAAMSEHAQLAASLSDRMTTSGAVADVKQAVLLGHACVNTGQYAKAVEVFNLVLKQHPGTLEAYLGRGSAYAMSNRFDAAVPDFSAAIKLQPTFADAWKRRGQVHAAMGKVRAVLGHLRSLLSGQLLSCSPIKLDVLAARCSF